MVPHYMDARIATTRVAKTRMKVSHSQHEYVVFELAFLLASPEIEWRSIAEKRVALKADKFGVHRDDVCLFWTAEAFKEFKKPVWVFRDQIKTTYVRCL